MPKKEMPAFSKRLKVLRETAGLTQQQLAVKAGLSVSNLSQLEQGQKGDPRASTLSALARALGIEVGSLFVGGPSTAPPRSPVRRRSDQGKKTKA